MKALEKKCKEDYDHMDLNAIEEMVKKVEDDKDNAFPLTNSEKLIEKKLPNRYGSLLVKIWVSHS